jgi:hypothetical protein
MDNTLSPKFKMDRQLVSSLSVALNYVENAYEQLNYFMKNEDSLTDLERESFYSYGRDKLQMNLVRLVNVKKSLMAIVGNKRLSQDVA